MLQVLLESAPCLLALLRVEGTSGARAWVGDDAHALAADKPASHPSSAVF